MPASLFHSFIRPRANRDRFSETQLDAAIRVLESVLSSGLLLVPEEVRLPLIPGIAETESERLIIRQLRLSLTKLHLSEIPAHAAVFGPVTVEFDLDPLRRAGVHPVYYFLSPPDRSVPGASDLGCRIIADLYETIQYLERRVCDGATDPERSRLLRMQSTLRGVASMFYPADSMQIRNQSSGQWEDRFSTDLKYFSQNEWRLVGGIEDSTGRLDEPLTAEEIERLSRIDAEFFHSRSRGFDGRPKSEFCRILRGVAGVSVRQWIKAVHVESWAATRCRTVLMPSIGIPVYEFSARTEPSLR